MPRTKNLIQTKNHFDQNKKVENEKQITYITPELRIIHRVRRNFIKDMLEFRSHFHFISP